MDRINGVPTQYSLAGALEASRKAGRAVLPEDR
jgi:hypothetical protein